MFSLRNIKIIPELSLLPLIWSINKFPSRTENVIWYIDYEGNIPICISVINQLCHQWIYDVWFNALSAVF